MNDKNEIKINLNELQQREDEETANKNAQIKFQQTFHLKIIMRHFFQRKHTQRHFYNFF